MATQRLEAMATALEASGHYRILRRLDVTRVRGAQTDGAPTRMAAVVDVETSGVDTARDEILQLSILPFRYSVGGDARVVEVLSGFNHYRQPSRPIPRVVTELTGIDDATVAGHTIESEDVDAFMARYELDFLVAHQVRFDKEFLMRAFPSAFRGRRWLCSMSQVPWDTEGLRGKALPLLTMQIGLFCRSHDAMEDCGALLALLNHSLPVTGRTALSYLLEAPREGVRTQARTGTAPRIRIRAVGARYESKDTLKLRGYRWSPGANGEPKAWFTELNEDRRDAEIEYLTREILGPRGKAVVEEIPPF